MADDDLDELRRLRPDLLLPDDEPPDPALLVLAREVLQHAGGAAGPNAGRTREKLPDLYPRLAYRDEMAALEFLVRAFGFEERREARMEHPDSTLAWLDVGDSVVMIGRAGADRHGLDSPLDAHATTAMLNVYVTDVDAHHARAAAEGARIVSEPQDMFWGDRRYEALDLEGHRWHFAQRLA